MTNKQTIDGLSRAALEALKSARLFISNGIDLGFIRMPDSETPDPAHNTLPMIDKAIQELRALLDKPAYPNRLCHDDYSAHPYICGCLKGDAEAQRRFDEHHAKAAQHQGEPVAWASPESLGGVRWRPRALDGLADGAPLYCRPPEQVAPLAAEAAKVFAKGFNTLESGGGKYRINMQFQSREDAWGAFNVLARLKQLNTPQ